MGVRHRRLRRRARNRHAPEIVVSKSSINARGIITVGDGTLERRMEYRDRFQGVLDANFVVMK